MAYPYPVIYYYHPYYPYYHTLPYHYYNVPYPNQYPLYPQHRLYPQYPLHPLQTSYGYHPLLDRPLNYPPLCPEPSSTLSSSSNTSQKTSGSGFSYMSKVHVLDKYKVVGFISSGTYGRVYKAIGKDGKGREFAIKKFKPDKEGEAAQYTGISQSAVREMSLCSELSHPNIIHLVEIILEDKCIFMVFEYCEHDLLQIIQHHSQGGGLAGSQQQQQQQSSTTNNPAPSAGGVGSGGGTGKTPIPAPVVKSTLFQLLNGLHYLHCNWVLHRDLKPANIMLTSSGAIRIGDLGLARLFRSPLNSLYSGDKVVVTIWYRAPELLLGARHYTPAIDLWAVGCIFAEVLGLRPIFKGEEAKMDGKKGVPFQRNQMGKIVEVLGMPDRKRWDGLSGMPEYGHLATVQQQQQQQQQGTTNNSAGQFNERGINIGLERWYHNTLASTGYPPASSSSSSVNNNNNPADTPGELGLDLLNKLLEYDPTKRLTAEEALRHPYFEGEDGGGKPSANCFEGVDVRYPHRRVSQDDNDIRTVSLPGTRKTVGGAAGAGGGGLDEGVGGGGKRGRYMGD